MRFTKIYWSTRKRRGAMATPVAKQLETVPGRSTGFTMVSASKNRALIVWDITLTMGWLKLMDREFITPCELDLEVFTVLTHRFYFGSWFWAAVLMYKESVGLIFAPFISFSLLLWEVFWHSFDLLSWNVHFDAWNSCLEDDVVMFWGPCSFPGVFFSGRPGGRFPPVRRPGRSFRAPTTWSFWTPRGP